MSDAGFIFNFSEHTQFTSELKIGVVVSLWNSKITDSLYAGCIETLKKYGVRENHISSLRVPGAFELPLGAQHLFNEEDCDAVIVLGCVIQGETPHFNFICEGCTKGIMDLQLKYNKPIGFGLLTTLNEEQAKERIGGKHGHKGIEAAETVLHQLITIKKR